jgi:putative FmdB family regulatory protein
MPTYDYKCDACGYAFEQFQSMTAAPIRRCPKCKKLKVKRLIGTGAGLIFKGSGFYITDYRSNNYKEGAKKDAPPAASSGGEKSSGSKESGGAASTPAAPAKPAETKPSKPAGNS